MAEHIGVTRRALLSISAAAVSCRGAEPDYDSLVRPLAERGEFMGTVLVSRLERIAFQQAYGFVDLEWRIPHAIDGRFRIGSISKQFTAACILLLGQTNRIDLDAPIATYVPDTPASWNRITVHHLLTHTSGIPDFLGFPDYQARKPLPSSPSETLLRFRDRPLEFTPGTQGKYSNSGYILLAYILERVSGESFANFLSKNILDPLRLRDTGVDTHRAVLLHRARGYTRFREGLGNADYIDMSIATGGGSLYSTANDLHHWTLALHGGSFLSPEAYRRMTTPMFHNYGYGLEIRGAAGERIIGHAGGMEGFSGNLQFRERDRVVCAVLANVNTNVTGRLANQLAALAEQGA